MPVKPRVEIDGLKDLIRDLKDLDPALAKEIKEVNLEVAKLVADIARAKVPSKSGKARASYKPRGEQRYATVKAGGARTPYVPWLEFGGRRGSEKKPSRAYYSEGRYLWPTIGAQRQKILAYYVNGLDNVMDKAGL